MKGLECDQCGTTTAFGREDEWWTIESAQGGFNAVSFDFCSWECVSAYAATHLEQVAEMNVGLPRSTRADQ